MPILDRLPFMVCNCYIGTEVSDLVHIRTKTKTGGGCNAYKAVRTEHKKLIPYATYGQAAEVFHNG